MTLRVIFALRKEWERHPPVHIMFAAFAGYQAPAEAKDNPSFGQFMRDIQGKG